MRPWRWASRRAVFGQSFRIQRLAGQFALTAQQLTGDGPAVVEHGHAQVRILDERNGQGGFEGVPIAVLAFTVEHLAAIVELAFKLLETVPNIFGQCFQAL